MRGESLLRRGRIVIVIVVLLQVYIEGVGNAATRSEHLVAEFEVAVLERISMSIPNPVNDSKIVQTCEDVTERAKVETGSLDERLDLAGRRNTFVPFRLSCIEDPRKEREQDNFLLARQLGEVDCSHPAKARILCVIVVGHECHLWRAASGRPDPGDKPEPARSVRFEQCTRKRIGSRLLRGGTP